MPSVLVTLVDHPRRKGQHGATHIKRFGLAGAAAATVMTASAFTGPAVADPASAPASERIRHRATQQAMDAAVTAGVPGVTGQAMDKYGTWNGTSGVGDLKTQQPRGAQDRYRVASTTKTFVSKVLLQLEAEGDIGLDDTVEQWLPGVVHGHGYDGSKTPYANSSTTPAVSTT